MIQLDDVTKRFPGGQEALSGLTLSIDKGEMLFITGHSGAGKSTLLRLIALIERPTSGQVIVDGQNTRRVRRRKIPAYRRQIGMVFQDHKLLYDRPVSDNVALPLVIAGVGHREAGRRVRAALDQVGLLHKEKQRPETLSAGEQQRVGIARAIVTRPKLLIADEPTGNLDPDLSLEVMRIFRRFNEVGVTLLIASHDLSLIDRMGCSRIALEDGRLVENREEVTEFMSEPLRTDQVRQYVDGEMSATELAHFERRMAVDAELRQFVAFERQLKERVAVVMQATPPAELRPRIEQALAPASLEPTAVLPFLAESTRRIHLGAAVLVASPWADFLLPS